MFVVAPVVAAVFVAFVAAEQHQARQAPAQPSGTSSPAATGSLPPNGTATSSASNGPPTFPITLISTNPTAVPLSSIVATLATTATTIPLPATFAAGTIPTLIPGAPALPDISQLNPQNYPHLDQPPPTDSPEVQQWIQQLSTFQFPNISQTNTGGCGNNTQAAADTTRCWWTCGQCSQSTDIVTCPDKLTWGSSFDDGPAPYTPDLLTYLDQQNLRSTFFVVGSRVISRPDYLRTQYIKGHQIAVHTWSHFPLTTLTNDQIIAEFGWSKKVIKDVLGVQPIYMRPPFGDIDDRVRAISAAMNLTPVIWTSGKASNMVNFDTGDFNIDAGTISASGVLRNFSNILQNANTINSGFIVLEHDLFQQSVELATGYILPEALAMNLKIQPIVTCQHMPLSNAYLETNDNSSNPLPTAVGPNPIPRISPTSPNAPGGATSGGNNAAVSLRAVGGVVLGATLGAVMGVLAVWY